MSFFDFCWEIENLLKNLIKVNSKSTGMSKAHTYQRLFECQSIDGFEGFFKNLRGVFKVRVVKTKSEAHKKFILLNWDKKSILT